MRYQYRMPPGFQCLACIGLVSILGACSMQKKSQLPASDTDAGAVSAADVSAAPPPESTSMVVSRAFVARELDAVFRATTPEAFWALPSVLIVSLGEATREPSKEERKMYIIARGAYMNVAADGRFPSPEPFTEFRSDGSKPCVWRAEKRVLFNLVSEIDGSAKFEAGAILEGCPLSPNVYEVTVVRGAHPHGQYIAASAIPAKSAPPWMQPKARRLYKFARTEPLFVAVRDASDDGHDKLEVGSASRLIGSFEVPRTFSEPEVLDVGKVTLLLVRDRVVEVTPDGVIER